MENITTPRRTRRHFRALSFFAAGLAGVLPLAGCTASESPDPAGSSSSPAVDTVEAIAMPDLGPSPAPDVLTDEQIEQMRLTQQDSDWHVVPFMFPDAVRPVVEFERFADADTYLDTLHACYVASGLKLGIKVNEIGETELSGAEVSSQPEYLAKFVCQATVVMKPAPWNAAQVRYHYDYLTRFLAPCYQANGIENPPAPSREDYIAKWPNPGWGVELGDAFTTPEAAPIVAACPFPYD